MSLRRGRPAGYGSLLNVELECSGRVVEVSVPDAGHIARDRLSAAIERRDYVLTPSGPEPIQSE